MRIDSARVIVCAPGRNFVTLKIITDGGVYGIGDGTLNGREQAVVAYLEEHVVPALVGRDPHAIEDVWHYLYRGAYWRRGPVTMAAIAAVDVALWDIKAKVAGLPLYQLLGGRSRDRVMTYAHATGRDIDGCLDAVARCFDAGYSAVRVQAGVPGLDSTYGVPDRPGDRYEPAGSELPAEQVWDTAKYLSYLPELIATVRERFGYGFHLLHDVHHRLTPIEAARLGKALEPYRLFWLEDCVPAELQEGFRVIREHTTTPLAVGEVFNTVHDARLLIENQWIDYIRAAISHAGGITHMRRIAHLAELYHVRTGFHGPTDVSPVGLGATLHVDTWVPNFGIQEHMPHDEVTDAVFPHDYRFEAGNMIVGDSAGHGVDIDEMAAARFPYQPASLPVSRLEDGTIWNW